MRMLSSRLLLGSVASLAMMSVAGAADLPMKAKAPAVQYVKICSLYGAGFYYIPGTDTCLKVGGHMRIDMHYGPTGGPYESVNFTAFRTKAMREFHAKTRAYATFDARSQTAYGTLRYYATLGANLDNVAGAPGSFAGGLGLAPFMFRAFIQLAGFTWGLTDSIFDLYGATPVHLNIVAATNGSVGATGIWQWRYTAQFGSGMSASIAIEEPDRRQRAVGTAFGAGAVLKGAKYPDVTAQLGASGPWGRAQVAAALHDTSTGAGVFPATGFDKIGWAAMAGAILNVPGMPGDNFGVQFTYAKGATGYVTGNINTIGGFGGGGLFVYTQGNQSSVGFVTDGVVIPGGVDLTTAWGFEAGYQHAWSQTLRSSIAGGYVRIEHSAAASAVLCTVPVVPPFAACTSANSGVWNVGTRTLWTPVQNFSLGVDVLYTHIDSVVATPGTTIRGGTPGFRNNDILTGMVRVTRNFWP